MLDRASRSASTTGSRHYLGGEPRRDLPQHLRRHRDHPDRPAARAAPASSSSATTSATSTTLAHFVDRGLVKPPFFVQLGRSASLGGIGADPEDVMHMKQHRRQAVRRPTIAGRCSAGGRHQMHDRRRWRPTMGGNVRVGLEDSLCAGKGRLATVERRAGDALRQIVEGLGLEIATPAEAREQPPAQGRRQGQFLGSAGFPHTLPSSRTSRVSGAAPGIHRKAPALDDGSPGQARDDDLFPNEERRRVSAPPPARRSRAAPSGRPSAPSRSRRAGHRRCGPGRAARPGTRAARCDSPQMSSMRTASVEASPPATTSRPIPASATMARSNSPRRPGDTGGIARRPGQAGR